MAYPDDPYDNPEDGFLLRADPKPIDTHKESRSLLKIIFTLAVVAGAGTLGWYALVGIDLPTEERKVPLVQADLAPIKEPPAKPGGMDVPNQDKLVYNRLPGADGDQATTVERLLPPPETPLPPPQPVAPVQAAPADPPPQAPEETMAEAAPDPLAKAPVSAAKAPVADPPAAVAEKAPASQPNKAVAVAKPPPPPPPAAEPADVPLSTASRGNGEAVYRVQLAAVRDKERAELAWKQLLDKHGALLSGHDHHVVRADLGDKGVFYRLRAGAFGDLAEARSFCAKLTKAKVGCLVVKNGG